MINFILNDDHYKNNNALFQKLIFISDKKIDNSDINNNSNNVNNSNNIKNLNKNVDNIILEDDNYKFNNILFQKMIFIPDKSNIIKNLNKDIDNIILEDDINNKYSKYSSLDMLDILEESYNEKENNIIINQSNIINQEFLSKKNKTMKWQHKIQYNTMQLLEDEKARKDPFFIDYKMIAENKTSFIRYLGSLQVFSFNQSVFQNIDVYINKNKNYLMTMVIKDIANNTLYFAANLKDGARFFSKQTQSTYCIVLRGNDLYLKQCNSNDHCRYSMNFKYAEHSRIIQYFNYEFKENGCYKIFISTFTGLLFPINYIDQNNAFYATSWIDEIKPGKNIQIKEAFDNNQMLDLEIDKQKKIQNNQIFDFEVNKPKMLINKREKFRESNLLQLKTNQYFNIKKDIDDVCSITENHQYHFQYTNNNYKNWQNNYVQQDKLNNI